MTWVTIKPKLYAIGAFLMVLLAAIARFKVVKKQRDKAIDRADREKARADQSEAIADADTEISRNQSDLKREADNAIKNDDVPDNLRNPNDW